MTDSLVFLSGKRTPFGANGASLRDVSPTDLGVHASQAALAQAGIDPGQIEHVIFGNVLHSARDSIYMPRHIGLKSGVPKNVPALGVNRLCGSGFQTVVEAFQQMAAGDTRLALVGGVENMSMSPYVLRGARWGLRLGHAEVYDLMTDSLIDTYAGMPMAITAENLAVKYKIDRTDSDRFALRSQLLAASAQTEGRFTDEIAPMTLPDGKGATRALDRDEHPRPQTTQDTLAKLKTVFKKDGVVTAGNASGIVDGAAAMVVATESEANRLGKKPLGRMIAYSVVGCEPSLMGIGPAPAIREVLKKSKMKIDAFDLIEINEAFAPQTLAVVRDLELDEGFWDSHLNVNGGAIAIGHPLAASGTRILMHLLYELKRRGKRYGLGSACIGGGQGIAIAIEAL